MSRPVRAQMPFKRRLLTANLAVLLGLSSTATALADGPVGGSHVYRQPARVSRAAPLPVMPVAPAPLPVSDGVTRITLTADQSAATVEVVKGKSAIIELPSDVRDMLVTNPVIADAILRDKRHIHIVGMTEGSTDAAFFDAYGRRIVSLNIRVTQPADILAATLSRVLPDAKIQVQPIRDSVVLTGTVRNASESDAAARIAAQFTGKADNVLNLLSVAGKDQVMLQVRIVEVQRSVIKQLGISTSNMLHDGFKTYGLGRDNTFGVNGALLGGADLCYGRNNLRTTNNQLNSNNTTTTGNSASNSVSSNSSLSNNFSDVTTVISPDGSRTLTSTVSNGSTTNTGTASGTSSAVANTVSAVAQTAWQTVTGNNLNACLQAFERVGLVRTLAEPNLTAVSGEAGRFLVGGEFPVPTGNDQTGKVTIEFKPYGVGLGFTPVVLSGGRISVKLSTEVSELSSLGAFSLSNGAGSAALVVPGLSVRRVETMIEAPSGGAFMIAGLLQQTTKETIDSLPGMTSLPVLGALFRSRDFLNGETELVIIVTPYIVDPTRPQNLQTPADGLKFADDMSTVLMGRLNKVVKAPAGANAGRAYQGPVGYVIE